MDDKSRAEYWHRKTTFLMAILGGEVGAVIGYLIVQLIGN